MGKKDPRVDAYIAKAAPFAKPILTHLRKLVHRGCPDIEETIKWSFPHFQYKGILCSMAAFKEHCAFGFWKASLMSDPKKALKLKDRSAMGHLERITSVADLPADSVLVSLTKEAAKLNDAGAKGERKPKARSALVVPDYVMAAIRKNKRALATFAALPPSHKREYVEWITEAKREETRSARLKTTISWLAEGKARNWKYERKSSKRSS